MATKNDPENTLLLETTKGPVTIALRPDLAPQHVARIKELARKGFYDGIVFHRVIDGFMAQTGDPDGHRHGRLRQEAEGGVFQGAAQARHGLDGTRLRPELGRLAVLHLLRRRPLPSTASTPSGGK